MGDPRWVGIVVSGTGARLVDLEVPATGPLVAMSEQGFSLQKGDRPKAYVAIWKRIENYLRENEVECAVVKESALPPRGNASKSLLESAELRGVVLGAAASVCRVITSKRATVSRTFGDRKVDDYLSDDSFWATEISGLKNKVSREATLLVLAEVRARTNSTKKSSTKAKSAKKKSSP